jgi:hypothetical protein
LLFIAVLAIHLVFVAALIEVTRLRTRYSTPETIVSTLIYLPRATPNTRAAATPRPQGRLPHAQPERSDLPPSVNAPLIQEPPAVQPYIDWTASAHEAVQNLLASETRDRRIARSMGSGWWSAFDEKQQHLSARRAFPWSPQRKFAGAEIDPDNFIVTFHLGPRCAVAVFVILPGFGCALGRLDPEPGQSDLFDAKYRPAPLELPTLIGADGPAP